jgi:hypothetical protein
MKVICPNSEKCGYDCVHREYHDEHNHTEYSIKWYKEQGYIYMGEFHSRKEKLKKLQNG